jgi:uncharacterized protein YjbJ (UPF0337 family)
MAGTSPAMTKREHLFPGVALAPSCAGLTRASRADARLIINDDAARIHIRPPIKSGKGVPQAAIGTFRRCRSANLALTFTEQKRSDSAADAPGRRVQQRERVLMDKDRIAGSVKQVKGAAESAVGKAIGDAKLQSDGKIDSAVGKIQNAIGGANDAVREAAKKS